MTARRVPISAVPRWRRVAVTPVIAVSLLLIAAAFVFVAPVLLGERIVGWWRSMDSRPGWDDA